MDVIQTPEGAKRAETTDWYTGVGSARRGNVLTTPHVGRIRRSFASRLLPAFMVICGAAAAVASRLPWMTTKLFSQTTHVLGTSPAITKAISVNGWITFGGGIALAALSALMIVSAGGGLRFMAFLAAGGTVGFAVYDTVRLWQKIDDARHALARFGPDAARLEQHVHLGYGIIALLVAAGLAFLASLVELGSS